MKLKELIKADSQYKIFKERLDFYENSWDVTLTISNYLNSPDVKKEMDEKGPYVFKELSSQDQMVLIKLQYEGRIKELEKTVAKQQKELEYYRNNREDHKEGNWLFLTFGSTFRTNGLLIAVFRSNLRFW